MQPVNEESSIINDTLLTEQRSPELLKLNHMNRTNYS